MFEITSREMGKTYNDDLNNKILEVNELKNKLKEMDKKKRENEVEINNLKKICQFQTRFIQVV